MIIPQQHDRWKHRRGEVYRVLCVTNKKANNHYKWPITVVYRDVRGDVWSRNLEEFLKSFEKLS